MNKYILLEGVDLAGKSSAVKSLLDTSHWNYQHSSLLTENPILKIAREVEKDGSEWIGHLYVEALSYDLSHFQPPLVNTIQDSTILLRTLAFNGAAGYMNVVKKLEGLALHHPTFDKIFILTASLDARRKRLKKRIEVDQSRVTPNDLRVVREPEFFQKMENLLIDYTKIFFREDPVIIDTSNLLTSDVVSKVLQEM